MVLESGEEDEKGGEGYLALWVFQKHFKVMISTSAFKNADVVDGITVPLFLVLLPVGGLYILTLSELRLGHGTCIGQ